MNANRREWIQGVAATGLAATAGSAIGYSSGSIRAVTFDAFSVLDPRAYRMGLDALGLKRNEVVFAAFACWDAAGAKPFGYPTYWVARQNQPGEEPGMTPDLTSRTEA